MPSLSRHLLNVMRTCCAFGVAPVLATAVADLQGKNDPFNRQPLPLPLPLGHWKMAQIVGTCSMFFLSLPLPGCLNMSGFIFYILCEVIELL